MNAHEEDASFDWSYQNQDVIVPEQRSLAVYKNNFGQAVIRVERNWDEEGDPFVAIDHAQIPAIIAALRAIADEPVDRTTVAA
jgi:hypothetical protein